MSPLSLPSSKLWKEGLVEDEYHLRFTCSSYSAIRESYDDILRGNCRSYEWWDYELRKLRLSGEHEDKYEDQGDNMAYNENTRLTCQWLVLNPLKGT